MLDLNRKLEKGFMLIDPDISTQKAFELLAEPEISILIFISRDKETFYYLTEQEINKSIKKNNKVSKMPVREIAVESLVFDYNQFAIYKMKYLIKFKKRLTNLGRLLPDKVLVLSDGKPIGLVSDLVFGDIPDTEPKEFKSKLDLYIESIDDPHAHLDQFYATLVECGFEITPEVKADVISILEKRLLELKNNKGVNEVKVSKLEAEEAELERAKSEASTEISKTEAVRLAIIYNPSHITHRSESSSPEMPERLVKIMDVLKKREKIFNSHCKLISDYPPATEEDLLRVHTEQYIEFIKNYAAKGGGFLGDSTYITKTTHELALLAVGGAIRAAEEVLAGKAEFGIALIRPPGHHASKDKYGGYCIYNNAAVLARYLQAKKGLGKIFILDWDAHAANGTLNIFYDDPSVMLVSMHQDPHNFYPKTGFISQLGKSKGIGYSINMEMPRGSGDEEYLTVFNELVLPLFEKYKPDFVIGCNGFDPHHSDQYTNLQLTGMGYYKFSEIFREHMKNKMVILMEGGYNPYMGELTLTIINGLLGQPNQFKDKHISLVQKVLSDEKIQIVFNNKLKELKYNLKRYHVL